MSSTASEKYLSAEKAIELDQRLMTTPGFSIDQLMELAGLSVASSIAKEYDSCSHNRLLLIAGPGNNGGDALVAARHLFHFGYSPTVFYPKRSSKQLFSNLVHQLEQLKIPLVQEMPSAEQLKADYSLLVDAIFGFSFTGSVRAPFDAVLKVIVASKVPVVSVDIPSGWDVNTGFADSSSEQKDMMIQPEMLISLTAPKPVAALCEVKHHYLGGRFLPPSFAKDYDLEWLPNFPGTEQCVKLN